MPRHVQSPLESDWRHTDKKGQDKVKVDLGKAVVGLLHCSAACKLNSTLKSNLFLKLGTQRPFLHGGAWWPDGCALHPLLHFLGKAVARSRGNFSPFDKSCASICLVLLEWWQGMANNGWPGSRSPHGCNLCCCHCLIRLASQSSLKFRKGTPIWFLQVN